MKKSLFLGIVIYMYEWYFCKKKLRKECNLLEMSIG